MDEHGVVTQNDLNEFIAGEEVKLRGDVVSHEKMLNNLILMVSNIRDQLAVLDRLLLSMSGVCLSCGHKKELPPELNGICSGCEQNDYNPIN